MNWHQFASALASANELREVNARGLDPPKEPFKSLYAARKHLGDAEKRLVPAANAAEKSRVLRVMRNLEERERERDTASGAATTVAFTSFGDGTEGGGAKAIAEALRSGGGAAAAKAMAGMTVLGKGDVDDEEGRAGEGGGTAAAAGGESKEDDGDHAAAALPLPGPTILLGVVRAALGKNFHEAEERGPAHSALERALVALEPPSWERARAVPVAAAAAAAGGGGRDGGGVLSAAAAAGAEEQEDAATAAERQEAAYLKQLRSLDGDGDGDGDDGGDDAATIAAMMPSRAAAALSAAKEDELPLLHGFGLELLDCYNQTAALLFERGHLGLSLRSLLAGWSGALFLCFFFLFFSFLSFSHSLCSYLASI